MSRTILLCFFVLLGALIGCRKDASLNSVNPSTNTPSVLSRGTIRFKLKNVVGSKSLILNEAEVYVLPNGEELSVSSYSYYLSNFVFTDEIGSRFSESESYHLVMAQKPESLSFIIKDVPFGKYRSIEFLIGVDSVRNFSGAQAGDLDPKYGMFWAWSTGYVMARLEGHSPQSSSPNSVIAYHIGGFKGPNSVLQKVKFNFSQEAIVSLKKTPVLTIQSDITKWFQSSGFSSFSFSQTPLVVSEGIDAYQISQNYSTMFSIVSVEN